MTIEDAIPEGRQREVSFDIYRTLKDKDTFQKDGNKQWLNFVTNRTMDFFAKNEHIFATESDKGGHTVIMETSAYDKNLFELLKDKENYVEIKHEPLNDLVSKKKHLIGYIKNSKRTEKFVKNVAPYQTLKISWFVD